MVTTYILYIHTINNKITYTIYYLIMYGKTYALPRTYPDIR